MNRSSAQTGEPSRARAGQKSASTDELKKHACTNEALTPFENKSRPQNTEAKHARYIYINETTTQIEMNMMNYAEFLTIHHRYQSISEYIIIFIILIIFVVPLNIESRGNGTHWLATGLQRQRSGLWHPGLSSTKRSRALQQLGKPGSVNTRATHDQVCANHANLGKYNHIYVYI